MHQIKSWPTVLPHAVVFDMDGLLLDTERLYARAIYATCTALGYTMTDLINQKLVGGPWEANIVHLLEAFGDGFPLDDYRAECVSRYTALCADGIALRPGVLELIDFLDGHGIPMAVATSTLRDMAKHHLHQTGLIGRLRALVARDDVDQGKPHPESYLTAASLLAVDPIHCLALEDSHNGARSAIAAGMATILVPDMLPATPEIRAHCVHVANDLHEVRAMLEAV